MNRSFILSTLLLFFTVLITACGGGGGGGGGGGDNDDDDDDTTVRTGVFIDGPVQGLSYETATQSGVTNADGEFDYINGETVTFSIGGIVLGSAEGAAEINPFDLFGMTPPTNELALRLQLNTRNDVTGFDRAANVAFLLVSLDNDNDPDNGIDLTGWDVALAGAELDFDLNMYVFARKFRRFAGEYDINPDVTPMLPLAHLYESLGITVQINLLTGLESDFNNNGVVDSVIDYTYNASGQLTLRTIDSGVPGVINQSKSYTYTADGRIATKDAEQDHDEDGAPNFIESYEYTYNGDGDMATTTIEMGGVTVNERSSGTATYNEFGDRLSWSLEVDTDLDDNTDQTLDFTYTYDGDGNKLTEIVESDYDLDTVVDNKDIWTYTYDATGNLLTFQRDEYGDDDTIDRSRGEVNTYNAAGSLLTKIFTRDEDGPGPGTTSESQITTNTYDSDANLATSILEEKDNGVDFSFRERTTNTYNNDGTLLLSALREQDTDFDGQFDDRRTTSTYTYGSGGWLTQLHETDTDGNGSIDTTSSSEHLYTVLNDGMFGLLYHYLDTTVITH